MAEWDSEIVRNAAVYDETFNLNLVLIMEDSESISDYAEYLAQTTESGIRPKFTSLNAGYIAKKVNKFLGRSSQLSLSTPEDFDFPERKLVDISAEAIKHSLLQLRYELESAASINPPEPTIDEITGVRSKDMLRSNNSMLNSSEKAKLLSGIGSKQEVDNLSKTSKKKKRKEKGDDELDSSGTGEKGKTAKREKRKKSKDKVDKRGDPDDTENEKEGDNKRKKSNSKKRSRSKSTLKSGSSVIRTTTTSMSSLPKAPPPAQSRNTILRKRGEPKKPNYIIEDDSPRDGPQLYVLLQGFYNPDLLDALHSIGVNVDGVVLLTTNKIEKRNFTVTDIEEIFPGAFQPQNMLPNYLKKIENQINTSGDGNGGGVPKFWMNLAKKLNKALPDSYIHDIALLNCEIPRVFNKEDRTPEQMGADSVEILAGVAKRIFEMAQFQKWHQNYQDAASASNIDPATSSKPINIYEDFMNRIPAECITLPVIMESLLAQVEQDVVENLFGNTEQTGDVHGDDKGNGILLESTDYLMTADQEEEEMDHITPTTSKKKLKSKSKKLHKKGKEKEKSDKGKPSISVEGDGNNKEEHGKHHKGKPSDKKSDKNLKHHESHSEAKVKKTRSRKRVKGKGSSKQWIPPPELTKVNFYANEFEGEEFPFTDPKASFNEEKSRIANLYGYRPLQSNSFQKEPEFDMCPPAPCFKAPIYIKTHDFASIRNCHLREDLAETVAANQVTGDYCSIKNFLWEGIQEFDKGLYMKLHANLTHFMHFLPPGVIDLKDMFFIIHLLMASGVEIHLQKEARAAALRDVEENCVDGGGQSHYCCDKETKKFRSLLDIYEKAKLSDGDELDLSHNYLALGTELVNARMILAPGSNNKFNVITSNNSGMEADLPPDAGSVNVEFGTSSDPEAPKKKSLSSDGNDTVGKGLVPEQPEGSIDKIHGAVIATGNIIANSAELAATLRSGESFEEAVNPETPPNTAIDIQLVDSPTRVQIPFGSDTGSFTSTSANENKNEEENNYEAQRQERYVQNLKDLAVLQALIACPALLAISESGALDISKWVETYLLCTGLPRASGEGVIVGQLRDWNHAEEMVPVQMIQALREASQSYLCMERIYCPFYDTILFIFNNPTPYSLYAESSYVTKLNTLAGLQHFLEYTLNDEEVMKFVLETEKSKGLAAVRTLSVGTLMRLIPEDQWVLIPSIKYTLQQMRGNRHGFVTDTEEEEWTEEEDGQRGAGDFKSSSRKSMKKGPVGASKLKLEQRRKTRNKTKIDLGEDLKSSLKQDSQAVTGEVVEEITIDPEKIGKKSKKKAESSGSAADSKSTSGKKTKDKNAKKGKKGEDDDKAAKKKSVPAPVVPDPEIQNQTQANRRLGKLKDEPETPLPLLSPQARPADSEPNFKNSLDKKEEVFTSELESLKEKKFHVYDLGKRHLITTSDDYHLFPLDGTIISYNVSTIEPDFRMMQLRVSKYGHDTFFYPYYIPHEADMTAESFVLIPHFHTVLANGTIFAFQDKRAQEDSKYLKNSYPSPAQSSEDLDRKFDPKNEFFDIPSGRLFNEENILFMDDNYDAMMKSKKRALRSVSHANGNEDENEESFTTESQPKEGPINIPSPNEQNKNDEDENQDTDDILTADAPPPVAETDDSIQPNDPSETGTITNSDSKSNKSKKVKKSKIRSEGSESLNNIEGSKKGKDKKKKTEGRDRSKSTSKGKKKPKSAKSSIAEVSKAQISSDKIEPLLEDTKDENGGSSIKSPMDSETMQPPGEWKYPSSDETDSDEKLIHTPSVEHLIFNWDEAEQLIQPLAHIYKITLPSGLHIEVNDMEGPPCTREIKQSYISKGSAYSLVEKSRHYLMNGTVLRFLTNGTIQSLNARGITTNIRELSARVPNEDNTEGPWERFGNASTTKVFKGDIILPTGEFWHIKRGKRTKHDPLFVFTSGTMPNGEIFRRRQDGTIYIHRSDGCCIIHYPDGTRFTTRMILQKDEVPEFEDWTFVGLKYMIEHPNYSPVIINSISGNIHIKLPQGEWTRILADGSIRIQSNDDYKISVDKNKAVLSTAGLKQANPAIPNLTAVKLFHSKDQLISDEKDSQGQPRASVSQSKYKQEWAGEGDEDFYAPIRSSVIKRQSFAGDATRGLMDQNLRPSSINSTRESLGIPNPQIAEENDGFDINNFIQFCDMWTLVKSTDTYDNRLAMDIFGNMVVDKSDTLEDTTRESAKEIVNSLSSEFQLPQQLLSGILSATSSKEFSNSNKLHRFLPLKKSHSDCSSPKPKTRILVVKRDLSGYEFLKQTVVDRMIRKAKINPEAIVLFDPLPAKGPRKFITIMEPIKDCENPNGMWKSLYREPVFRPQSICNKNLRVARPEDLRWFANILATAHQKRGNFFLSPKEEYLRKKERQRQEEEGRALEEEAQKLKEEREAEECRLRDLAEASRRMEEEKAKSIQDEKSIETSSTSKKKSKKGKEKGKKEQKDNESEVKSIAESRKSSKDKKKSVDDDLASEMSKNSKTKSKKGSTSSNGSKKKTSKDISVLDDSIDTIAFAEEEEEEEEDEDILISTADESNASELRSVDEVDQQSLVSSKHEAQSPLGRDDPGKYPENISDVKGLYGPEPTDLVTISPYHHEEIVPLKKAIIVRTIVEIPGIDDKLQQTLMAASKSYSEIIQEQNKVFESYIIDDPRTAEEKELERQVKRELIEENIQQMHLIEQTAGKLLQLVL